MSPLLIIAIVCLKTSQDMPKFQPFTFPKLACVQRYAETWESAKIVPKRPKTHRQPTMGSGISPFHGRRTAFIPSVDRECIDDGSLKGWVRLVSLCMLLQPPNVVWIS